MIYSFKGEDASLFIIREISFSFDITGTYSMPTTPYFLAWKGILDIGLSLLTGQSNLYIRPIFKIDCI